MDKLPEVTDFRLRDETLARQAWWIWLMLSGDPSPLVNVIPGREAKTFAFILGKINQATF